jgi:hypothetical protein
LITLSWMQLEIKKERKIDGAGDGGICIGAMHEE